MHKKAIFVLSTVALLVASCGQTEITADSNSVDINLLDSGNYPSTPLDVESLRTPESGALREAIIIGSHTPLPFEYDSRFEFGSLISYKQYVTRGTPPEGFDKTGIGKSNFNTEIPGLVAGWRTFGQRRYWPDYGRHLETYTLRFETAGDAKNASEKLFDRAPGEKYLIAGHPNVLTKISPLGVFQSGTMESWTALDEMLIYIKVADPVSQPSEPPESAAISSKFLDKQISLLGDYERTPLDEIPKLPMDVEGQLSRTLHSEKATGVEAVYPAHVALSLALMKKPLSEAFADAGVDYLSVGSAHVYRARDTAGAERLLAAMLDGSLDLTSLRSADPPPDLPSAACYEIDPNDSTFTTVHPQCFVTVGRHVARVPGTNLQDAYQRTAAQYKLLTPSK